MHQRAIGFVLLPPLATLASWKNYLVRIPETCRCRTFSYLIPTLDSVIEMVANLFGAEHLRT